MATSKEVTTNEPRDKRFLVPPWLYFGELLAEPIIVALAAFLFFDRIKSIWDSSPSLAAFWDRLSEHVWSDVLILLTFLGALALWAGFSAYRIKYEHINDERKEKRLRDRIDGLAENISILTEEIRKDRESRNEG